MLYKSYKDIRDERLKQRAYIRIDTLEPEKINDALLELCEQWDIEPVWLPHFRHALDATGTRQAIALYLLEGV
jgi:hypothetical protein